MTGTLGIIPARGGSSRVPDKNLRSVGSKPLIGHAVTSGLEARTIDKTIVSSDDERIRERATEFGAEVPFKRPAELATDSAQVQDVVTHALNHFEDMGQNFTAVVMLMPTTPFRTAEDIDGTVTRLEGSQATASISVSPFQTPPHWAVETDDSGYLKEYFGMNALWNGDEIPRSQDLPDLVHPNGAVFATTVSAWWEHETFYQPHTVGYEMPVSRSIDIDTVEDLQLARGLARSDEMPGVDRQDE